MGEEKTFNLLLFFKQKKKITTKNLVVFGCVSTWISFNTVRLFVIHSGNLRWNRRAENNKITCSAEEASSTFLSSRTRKNRGNRKLTPFVGSILHEFQKTL